MKLKLLMGLFLTALMAFGSFTASSQSTLAVGVLVVDDIDDSDPDLLTQSAVVSDDVYYDGKILIAAGTPVVRDIQYQDNRVLGVPAPAPASNLQPMPQQSNPPVQPAGN